MATCSSILTWKIPWTEELGWLQSMGLQRVRHNWAHIQNKGSYLLQFPITHKIKYRSHFYVCKNMQDYTSVQFSSIAQSYIHMCLCLVAQTCLTFCGPMDCSPPGSSVHKDSLGKNTGVGGCALLQGIFQPTDWTQVSLIVGRFLTIGATREALYLY